MKRSVSEQPKITEQITDETNKINEFKSVIKKKSDTQLLLDEELKKLDKEVQMKQNETAIADKKLIKLKKSFIHQKNKLY